MDTGTNEKLYSLSEFCEAVHISEATGRNWLRLGKLRAECTRGSKVYFSEAVLLEFCENGTAFGGNRLKSRRNKSRLHGHIAYADYLGKEREERFAQLLQWFGENYAEARDYEDRVRSLLAAVAERLLCLKYGKESLPHFDRILKQLNHGAGADGRVRKMCEELELFPEETGDILGYLYSSLRNISNRKAQGAYYTPAVLAARMVEKLSAQGGLKKDMRILDPGCGSGNFLILLLQNGMSLEQLHGYDIDETGVLITQLNLLLHTAEAGKDLEELCRIAENNIRCADFTKAGEGTRRYDLILGNPPWGAKTKEKSRCREDICDLFVIQAMDLLTDRGRIAFLVPEALFHVGSHKNVQLQMSQKLYFENVQYLENAFSAVVCPVIMFFAGKKPAEYCTVELPKQPAYRIRNERAYTCGYTFRIRDDEYECLMRMEQGEKLYLKGNADFALGIVTGDNGKMLMTQKTKESEAVITGADVKPYGINPPVHFLEYRPERFQQCAPEAAYRAKEKLVYRFIGNAPVVAYDGEGRLTLNSCNLMIPKLKDIRLKYIMAVLNSTCIRFYYKKKFHGTKVLKSSLEALPIPRPAAQTQVEIIRLAERLEKQENEAGAEEIMNKINRIIAKLYDLSEEDFRLIENSLKKA